MAFALLILVALLLVAKASLQPGLTGSLHVSSLNILQKIGIGYIGPQFLDHTTVLLDHISASTFLASLDIYDMHLRKDIDWKSLNTNIHVERENVLEFTLQDFSANADFDYIFSTWFTDSHGTGSVVIQGLKVRVLISIVGNQENWNLVLKQEEVSFNKLHINLSSSILQALIDFVQSTIQEKVSRALKDQILPPLNQQIHDAIHSTDPRALTAPIGDSGFYFSYFPSLKPLFSVAHNYVEVYINGLTYNNETLATVATHDLALATRTIGAQDGQIYFSDNTLTTLIHPLMVQFTHPYSQIKLSKRNVVSTIEMIAPSLASYFGPKAGYIIKTDYSRVSPEILIEKDKLTVKNLVYAASLSGFNETKEEVKAADFSMEVEGVFTLKMTNSLIRVGVEEIKVVPGSFEVESYIELGRSKASLEMLVDSTLKFLTEALGIFNREIILRDLLPEKYKWIAATLLSFEMSLGRHPNFGLLGISLKLI